MSEQQTPSELPSDAREGLMVAILQWVATAESPTDWEQRDLEVRPDSEGVPFVLRQTHGQETGGAAGMLPPEVATLVGMLQQAMFTPGKGTWLSAMFSVSSAGSGDARFNHDQQPVDARTGQPAMSAEQVRAHLEIFPREAEHVPAWMAVD